MKMTVVEDDEVTKEIDADELEQKVLDEMDEKYIDRHCVDCGKRMTNADWLGSQGHRCRECFQKIGNE